MWGQLNDLTAGVAIFKHKKFFLRTISIFSPLVSRILSHFVDGVVIIAFRRLCCFKLFVVARVIMKSIWILHVFLPSALSPIVYVIDSVIFLALGNIDGAAG